MPQSGPSREELENYFKNSRPYFDELAKHYYETDRQYYNKYIAPFYGPFAGIAPGKKGAGARITVLVASILVAVIGAGVAFFVAMETGSDEPGRKREIEDVREKPKKSSDKESIIKDTVSSKLKELSDYERGVEYYESEDYDNAERYLKRVPVSDENYGDAQQKLIEIKVLKTSGEYKRYIKPAPLRRKR